MPESPSLVHVEIFGQTYAVRAGADPEYLQALASFVDQQMQEVSRSSAGAVDSVRIAVLAALNIADELFRLREAGPDGGSHLEERARALADELGAALEE